MNREEMLARLGDSSVTWDILVVGGGATGLGVAVDAASRGFKTALLEAGDFAQGTSSRSTKIIHGGVRYLRQGEVRLVRGALRERSRLLANAPHVVQPLTFVIPVYRWYEGPYYGMGLRAYDALAGRRGLGRSRRLTVDETLSLLPGLEPEGLRGGVLYYDAQFDDARLAINLAQTAVDRGGVVANHMPVVALPEGRGGDRKLVAVDNETGREYELKARVVVNATGPGVDRLRRLENPEAEPLVVPSQGSHVVLSGSFLPGSCALMVPRTDDGRVLFAIPWRERVIVGTTDVPVEDASGEPRPSAAELEFLIEHAGRYLRRDPSMEDVRSQWAGVRPLAAVEPQAKTAVLSRDHVITVSRTGLVSVTGGKWTTYRLMAQETVDRAIRVGGLDARPCATENLRVHGHAAEVDPADPLACYGADGPDVLRLIRQEPRYGQPLSARFGVAAGEVVWAARHEMARTVEDFLARRSRVLFLDAGAAADMAEPVAALMAEELDRDAVWQRDQVARFQQLAGRYGAPSSLEKRSSPR
jgi:glycerol-3-phosphate dehydrogenase